MVATMQKDARRVFLALGGLATDKERVEETRKILDWSMTAFERKRLFEAGDSVGEASVYGGAVSHVQLVTAHAVDVLVPVNNPERLSAKVIYPLAACHAGGGGQGGRHAENLERRAVAARSTGRNQCGHWPGDAFKPGAGCAAGIAVLLALMK